MKGIPAQSKKSFGLLLFGGALGLSLSVLFLQDRYLANSRANAVQRAQEHTRNLAQAIDHNVSSTIQRIDHTLVSMAGELERELASGKLDLERMKRRLASEERLLPEVVAIRVAAANGLVILNNPSDNPLASLAERPFFPYLRDHPEGGLFITKPVIGMFTKKWVLVAARRYNLPDGRFGGVVIAPILLEQFQKALSGYEIGRAGLLTLRDGEGGFVARYPTIVKGQTLEVGDRTISQELDSILLSGVPRASYFTRSPFDQTRRTFGFRRLQAAPLVVLAGLAEEDYLSPWAQDRRKIYLMTLGVLLGTWLMAGALYHFWISRDREAQALRESEARYRAQFNLASEGILLLSPQGQVLEVNDAFARMHGYTLESFPRQASIRDINSPASNESVPDRLSRLLAGETLTFEVEHGRQDGRLFPVEVSASLISLDGKPAILAFHRDVTERRARELEIARMHRLYDMLVELGRSLVRTKTPEALLQETCTLAVEKAGFRLAWIGWLDPETPQVHPVAMAGEAVSYLEGLTIWADDRPEGCGPTGICIREDRSYVCQDFQADPATVPWRERAQAFRLGSSASVPIHVHGKVAGALMVYSSDSGIFLDREVALLEVAASHISFGLDHLAAEKLSRQFQDEISRSQKMQSLGSLAGGIAHDMNNVLGAILGLASLNHMKAPDGSSLQREMETIIRACERGGAMVKRLLSFARKDLVEELELNMNDLVREQVALLEHTTLRKVRLETVLAPDLHPIKGDPSALSHVLMNLCVNSVDAMPDNGTLTLLTRNDGDGWIEVSVQDSGSGMPKEVLEKALDPFFTTKGHGKGTGLGLAMVYATVKAHGGDLEIQSEPGQGTLVKMRLPAWEQGAEPAAPRPGEASEPVGRVLDVLLVDDDELIQKSLYSVLNLFGHAATVVGSGEEALAKLEGGYRPDVVILDMNMPGLGGAGTLPRLRELAPSLPVLLATGRADQAAQDLVATHAKVTLLPKPFSLEDLRQHLAALDH